MFPALEIGARLKRSADAILAVADAMLVPAPADLPERLAGAVGPALPLPVALRHPHRRPARVPRRGRRPGAVARPPLPCLVGQAAPTTPADRGRDRAVRAEGPSHGV